MKEFLLALLQSIIVAAVPVITVYACRLLAAVGKHFREKIKADSAKRLLDEAIEAVNTAVIKTSQVYVEALKQSGTFDLENQKEAFKMSYETAKSIMTQEAKDFITSAYGSLDDWLATQIEASVNRNK